MSVIKVNVPRPGKNAGQGVNPRTGDGVTIFDLDDVLFYPPRDENGAMIVDDIILKPGAYAITMYVTNGKSEITSNSEGETDNEGFTPSFKFTHPGNEREIREFKNNWLGRNVGVILNYCKKDYADIAGDRCNPLKLQVGYTANNDGNNNVITFAAAGKGDDIGMYMGTIPMSEPLSVIAAGSETIALIGRGQYQLTGGATATPITAVTGASHGLTFTLLGVKSETPPVIETGGSFLLKDGANWSAISGSQITFRAFKDGVSSFKFIEQSRT